MENDCDDITNFSSGSTNCISVLFLILLVIFNLFLNSYRAENAIQRAKLVKNDSELIGERIEIPRDGKASVKANLYVPDSIGDGRLPVVFNIHGGGFVGGDADGLHCRSLVCRRQHEIAAKSRFPNGIVGIVLSVDYRTECR